MGKIQKSASKVICPWTPSNRCFFEVCKTIKKRYVLMQKETLNRFTMVVAENINKYINKFHQISVNTIKEMNDIHAMTS